MATWPYLGLLVTPDVTGFSADVGSPQACSHSLGLDRPEIRSSPFDVGVGCAAVKPQWKDPGGAFAWWPFRATAQICVPDGACDGIGDIRQLKITYLRNWRFAALHLECHGSVGRHAGDNEARPELADCLLQGDDR